MADVKKITDRASIEHKTVCIKVGIIPGTGYALKFCEYLNGTGATDWYEDNNGNIKFKPQVIKTYKKDWIKERAGAKNTAAQEEALLAAENASKEQEKLKKLEESAKTTEEKIKAAKTKIQSLNQQIKKLEKEKNNVIKTGTKVGDTEGVEGFTASLDVQIELLQQDIKKAESDIETFTKQLDVEKKEAAAEKKKSQLEAKGNKWWYTKLKQHKQKQFNETASKEGKKPKKVSDEFNTEDIITLSVYANKTYNGENGTLSWDKFDADPSLEQKLNSTLTEIWNKFPTATSIRNDMDPKIVEESEAITPDSSAAFLKGAVSNTFEAAALGKELLSSPELIQQRATLMADATAAALNKLTSRVTEAVTMSTAQILDVSPIIAIPGDAAQEMVNHIMTPGQVMQAISDALNDEKLVEINDDELKNKINDTKAKFDEKVQEVNFLVGDKLNAFNQLVGDVKKVMNQSPDWYIDNINKIEVQLEKEVIKGIQDTTANVLDMKYQFRDNAVDVLAYNLVIPVNETLIKVQLEIVRKLVQAMKRAEQIAKAAAQKAIMKLLGLFGA